jgi:hypothetical protein
MIERAGDWKSVSILLNVKVVAKADVFSKHLYNLEGLSIRIHFFGQTHQHDGYFAAP